MVFGDKVMLEFVNNMYSTFSPVEMVFLIVIVIVIEIFGCNCFVFCFMLCTDWWNVHCTSSILPLHFIQCSSTDCRNQYRFSALQEAPSNGRSIIFQSRLPHQRSSKSHNFCQLPICMPGLDCIWHNSLEQPHKLGIHDYHFILYCCDVHHQRGVVLAPSVQ